MSDMPLLKLETTVALSDEKKKTLLGSLSKAVAGTTGKPEQYVMVSISHSAAMLMSGKAGEAAFVDIRGIGGLSGEVNRKLSQQVCKLLNESLGVAPDRVYLNFTHVDAGNWGWNGSTFG
jgi:phenylpyruvate tautomerase